MAHIEPLVRGQKVRMTRMFDGQAFQVFFDTLGEPWFLAREVTAFLGYTGKQSQNKAVRQYVQDSYKTTVGKLFETDSFIVATRPVGLQCSQVLINEEGIMALVIRCSLCDTLKFIKWFYSTVIPSLGKTQCCSCIDVIQSTKCANKPEFGVVYFVFDPNAKRFKIGSTHNLQSRISNLRTANPDIVLMRSITSKEYEDLEKQAHKYFENYHYKGEWFNITTSQVNNYIDIELHNLNV